ncbi:glycoside hydrolase/phage tail family protein [uncultured Cohaesibacter sp.]|uniref:baseplate multidomain protein megatron n=1 Tax=uncultured Cohaesibacter sp. TaxID=1002546 RepID=UPI002930F799|nr:glycoside hydrolase/phage tail family protein [uncultured Cohaesibacter sp.]
MTTLVLKTAGSVIGGALLGPVGAALGGALGATGGYLIDSSLFGSSSSEGSSLSDLTVQTSTEGSPIPRIYGRARLTGQVIWATNLVEEVTTRKSKTGSSKGGIGSSSKTTTYSYYANFAVGLCEGEIAYIGRVWANGTVLDLDDVTYRVYRGTDTQKPDSFIEAKQGEGKAPAYRGLAYVVFEDLPLEDFGNRIPQLAFEVVRPIGKLEKKIRSVVMIPGSTEFGYDTEEVSREVDDAEWSSENRHSYEPGTDFEVSLDHLVALCPNLERIALVVTWFGSDLRAGHCEIQPCVDDKTKVTDESEWSVAGLTRSEAKRVSLVDDRPAYGGTPSDDTVTKAIKAIRKRGLEVVFYPFIMMDIASGNGLPDPYGADEQAAFPWRGRITCYPGPDQSSTADKSSTAASQVTSFYSGQEWNYRRFIRHYAQLASDAGGVDAFLVGSELRGMTRLRDGDDAYPFVACLKSLASEVRSLLGSGTILTYGADWSEYFGHHPADEEGTVRYHLDPLWADGNIDVVGIDNYMTLSDWRSGDNHLDASLADTGLEADYLQSNIAGGEGYDWYYRSDTERDNQLRTEITDGSEGKPWVFRYKDLVNWWSNRHYDRDNGVEQNTHTAWQPESKPIWFTEIGCPAVHMGPNQPNVFPDPKSSESALPYYSSGARSDASQRAMLDASLDYWAEEGTDRNPASSSYDGSMVASEHMYLWAWDARPFPAFPLSSDAWSDGDSWHTGHWLNGRLGGAPLQDIIRTVMSDYGLSAPVFETVAPVIDGFVIESRMSVRSAIEKLCEAFNISVVASGSKIRFELRERRSSLAIENAMLVDEEDEALMTRQLQPWEEDVSSVTLSFNELFQDYRQSVARYDQPCARTRQDSSMSLAAISTESVMVDIAKNWLRQSNYARHSIKFKLPVSMLALEAGDLVTVTENDSEKIYRIDDIEDGEGREVSASLSVPRNTMPLYQTTRTVSISTPALARPILVSLDLPLLPGMEDYPHAPYLACYCAPWPGAIALYAGDSSSGFSYKQTLDVPAIMGDLLSPLPARYGYSWDRILSVDIDLFSGDLASVSEEDVLNGANAAAILATSGEWEILQFANAELIGTNQWRLSGILRGQLGTEQAAMAGADIGARIVLLDDAIQPLQVAASQLEKTLPFRLVPTGSSVNDKNNKDITLSLPGRGLVPLSPQHLHVSRKDDGLYFSWTRRGRLEADSWVGSTIPLSEESEQYSLSILHAETGNLLRQVECTEPEWLYSKSEQTADELATMDAVRIEVAQISQRVGSGEPLSRRLDLTSLLLTDLLTD